jgi:hypothetical protein
VIASRRSVASLCTLVVLGAVLATRWSDQKHPSRESVLQRESLNIVDFDANDAFKPTGAVVVGDHLFAVGSRVVTDTADVVIQGVDRAPLAHLTIRGLSKVARGYYSEQPRVRGRHVGLVQLHSNGLKEPRYVLADFSIDDATYRLIDLSGLNEPVRSLVAVTDGFVFLVRRTDGSDELMFLSTTSTVPVSFMAGLEPVEVLIPLQNGGVRFFAQGWFHYFSATGVKRYESAPRASQLPESEQDQPGWGFEFDGGSGDRWDGSVVVFGDGRDLAHLDDGLLLLSKIEGDVLLGRGAGEPSTQCVNPKPCKFDKYGDVLVLAEFNGHAVAVGSGPIAYVLK